MSESPKNHLFIDGGQVKQDDHVATYKAIPESETEFRTAKSNLSKSKEKVSDEAEEKLLDKEQEAKIVSSVVMADAKYVVGDHRNGDAKIELDANKRQFSGLTKEELLKYADDPFWVRLRWFMFILFWALWLSMLAGAITIIVRAPKCSPPAPRTWYEKGPLVDTSSLDSYEQIEAELENMQASGVEGIFTDVTSAYEVRENPDILERIKLFVEKAKEHGIKVIADLTPNFVSISHSWFELSANRTAPYDEYFTWARGQDYVDGAPQPPNNWVSTLNSSAWAWHEGRGEFYLQQYGVEQPDLNFNNEAVVEEFDKVLRMWMKAGVSGVRLHKVRQALVNSSLPNEAPAAGPGSDARAVHTHYGYWRHQHTRDQPALQGRLKRWAQLVADAVPDTETVFTLAEEEKPELFLLSLTMNSSMLRPPSAAPLDLSTNLTSLVKRMTDTLNSAHAWPLLQLSLDGVQTADTAAFSLLLPAAPVFTPDQLVFDNETQPSERLSHLVSLRSDASIEHGSHILQTVPATDSDAKLLAIVRWSSGHTGYVAVINPGSVMARANATLWPLPAALTVHHASATVAAATNYTTNHAVQSDDILVPAKSTVVLSFVPRTEENN